MIDRILQHMIWSISVGIGTIGLFVIVDSSIFLTIAILSVAVLLFGSACINQVYIENNTIEE